MHEDAVKSAKMLRDVMHMRKGVQEVLSESGRANGSVSNEGFPEMSLG